MVCYWEDQGCTPDPAPKSGDLCGAQNSIITNCVQLAEKEKRTCIKVGRGHPNCPNYGETDTRETTIIGSKGTNYIKDPNAEDCKLCSGLCPGDTCKQYYIDANGCCPGYDSTCTGQQDTSWHYTQATIDTLRETCVSDYVSSVDYESGLHPECGTSTYQCTGGIPCIAGWLCDPSCNPPCYP
jgi:hypothetical protein